MAKASAVAARTANSLTEQKEQLDRIEEMLKELIGQTKVKKEKPAQEVKEK